MSKIFICDMDFKSMDNAVEYGSVASSRFAWLLSEYGCSFLSFDGKHRYSIYHISVMTPKGKDEYAVSVVGANGIEKHIFTIKEDDAVQARKMFVDGFFMVEVDIVRDGAVINRIYLS